MKTPRHRHVLTDDGVRLNVVEAGQLEGPALVFVHGLASSWHAWEGVLADPQLAERYRLVAFDLRGHGRSDTALEPAQLVADGPQAGARLWSRDVDAVLAGLDSPVLVGWSFGSGVIQSWLYTHGGPGDVKAVVLACSPNVNGPVAAGDSAAELIAPEAAMILVGAAHDGDAFARRILASSAGDSSFSAQLRETIARTATDTPAGTVAGVLHHVIDFRPFLAALSRSDRERITAVIPDGDQIFNSAASQAVWTQVGVRTVHVPDAGHALPIREPERFAQLLLEII